MNTHTHTHTHIKGSERHIPTFEFRIFFFITQVNKQWISSHSLDVSNYLVTLQLQPCNPSNIITMLQNTQ